MKTSINIKYAVRSISDIADEIIKLYILGSNELGPGKTLCKCDECDANHKSR